MASDAHDQNSPPNNNSDHRWDHDHRSIALPAKEEDFTLSLQNNNPKRADLEEEDEIQVNMDSDPITSSAIAANSTPPMTEFPFRDAAEEIAREDEGAIGIGLVQEERRAQQQQPVDESRKLFQRLWTDEDEIELLQGFLEYTNQRGASGQHHYDTTLFYDQIKSKLQLEFNKNQLVEKLRRLKKKYRNIISRISAGKEVAFKSPHDQATFDISCKIWSPNVGAGGGGGMDDEDANININLTPNRSYSYGNTNSGNHSFTQSDSMVDERNTVKSRKRLRMKAEDNRDLDERVVMTNSAAAAAAAAAGPSSRPSTIPTVIEETVRSCLPPMFKEIMDAATNGSCRARGIEMMSTLPVTLGSFGNMTVDGVMDEKWRRQQILELELYSRRLELVQDEIKMQLQELRSAGS